MGDIPEENCELAESVRAVGGRALLVGGCVRDRLMGWAQTKDWDVEVYGVEPARLRELLDRLPGRVSVAGEAFTVYKIGARPRRFVAAS